MVYKCTLSPEMQKKAFDELHEDPARREQDIQHIRNWIKKQPHLKARTDDWTILRFLRGCKFSLERTKEKIDMFYTCRSAIPEWFQKRDPRDPKIREILKLGLILPLQGHAKNGETILLNRSGFYDPKKVSLDVLMRSLYLLFDVFLEEAVNNETCTVAGDIMVGDMTGMSMAHFLQFTPPLMKQMAVIWQDGYPMRPKGIHYVNTPPTFEKIFNIFKSFMKEKIKKRVVVHGSNMESLYEYIPKDMLPKEYGGSNGTIQELTDYWLAKVDERRDWLLEEDKYGVDESKRAGKPKTTVDLFGIEGSFRKLNVD